MPWMGPEQEFGKHLRREASEVRLGPSPDAAISGLEDTGSEWTPPARGARLLTPTDRDDNVKGPCQASGSATDQRHRKVSGAAPVVCPSPLDLCASPPLFSADLKMTSIKGNDGKGA